MADRIGPIQADMIDDEDAPGAGIPAPGSVSVVQADLLDEDEPETPVVPVVPYHSIDPRQADLLDEEATPDAGTIVDPAIYLDLMGRRPASPLRLVGAIARRFLRTPALVAAIPGGLHKGLAPGTVEGPDGNPMPIPTPYATIDQLANPVTYQSSGPTYLRSPLLLVKFWGNDPDQLVEVASTWEAVFHKGMIPLQIRDGYTCILYCADESNAPLDEPGADARPVHCLMVRMRGLTGHAPPAA